MVSYTQLFVSTTLDSSVHLHDRMDIRDPRIAGTFIKSGILFIIKNCNSWMKQPVVTGSFPTDLKAELTKELAAGQNKLGCNLLFLVATIAGVMHCMIIDLLFLFSAWIPLVKNSTNALVPEYFHEVPIDVEWRDLSM